MAQPDEELLARLVSALEGESDSELDDDEAADASLSAPTQGRAENGIYYRVMRLC